MFMQFSVHCAMQCDSCHSLGRPHFEMTDNLETQVATESQLLEAAAQLAKDKTPERLAAVPGPGTNQTAGVVLLRICMVVCPNNQESYCRPQGYR